LPLRTALTRILNLEEPFSEASKKLQNTWMFVNDELQFVKEFLDNNCVCIRNFTTEKTEKVKVRTLDVWLPEAGVYALSSGNHVLITKLPKRQWLKSFSDSYYRMSLFGNKDQKGSLYKEASKSKKQNIYVDQDKYIWWWDVKIGFVNSSHSLKCTNQHYEQELRDWNRNANI
jgi:hypothetical protein